ncbi:branched-chain amino acid transport system II carrier protein [Peptoniphilus indolicus]|uniref:Branched-chain amino acid transport system carrier protein n=2 Tax=Peptoniphilus indolicus TaxID=33030 RepID=G4D6L8_9FIRM|nr:branched-chain amino acid transport system II carrier protein [Peptoniphilus indolicus]EGY76445.1 LIVCS family branched chain amino acid:cation symporter [Peptoniphilus indolicus ATCC 29427]SUB76034.1 LIV-II [Peptoniphilus indolicus]
MKRNIILISAMALFSMLFGAGNLIFPPTLGMLVGDQFITAFLGFVITGVGLVLLGIVSTIKAGGTIDSVAKKLGTPAAKLFGTLILLSIGPGIAIPRTAATTFEVIRGSLLPNLNPVLVSAIFFGLTLFFTFSPNGIIDSIGKFLTPALLITLAIIIIKSILTPIGKIVPTGFENSFSYGFQEGYQTMDMIAALAFTVLLIDGFKKHNISDKDEIASLTLKSGVIATFALALVYFGLARAGATVSGLNLQDYSRVDLLLYIAESLLGNAGKIFISLAMSLACLTTSIGLTSTVANFFERSSNHKIKFSVWAILSTLVSGYFSIMGVDQIVSVAAPILIGLYPVSMVLIFLNLFPSVFKKSSTYIGAVLGACIPAINSIFSAVVGHGLVDNLVVTLPASLQSFYWIIPAVVLGLLFTLLDRK